MTRIDEANAEWSAAFRRAGHEFVMTTPKQPDQVPEIDWFVLDDPDPPFHYGPMCKKCGYCVCVDCVSPEEIEPCTAQDVAEGAGK
ncbi:MAG: hypothetical protein EBR82_80580 [Caulobacteraceae bacterium]|nr:hypothetical protein [Caulobacteraceae bacterium]